MISVISLLHLAAMSSSSIAYTSFSLIISNYCVIL